RTNNQELTTTFLFDLSLSGTTPKELTKRPDGIISLSPTFQDSNGEYLFHFEKPYAYDANGARTDNVLMQIGEDRSVPGKYYLKLTVDPTWLNDPARVYPVVIDPTVVHDTTTEFSAGTLDRVKDTGTGSVPSLETYYQELPADEHTVGLWHMNEGSGSSVADSSGNGNDGTATGTSIVSGKLNNARGGFDGGTTKIQTAAFLTHESDRQYTLSAWVYQTGGQGTFLVKESTWNDGFKFWGSIASLYFRAGDGTNAANIFSAVSTGASLNEWVHVAISRNSSVWTLYINGKEVSTTSNTTIGDTNVSSVLKIGNRDTTWDPEFQGQIDEVRISNIARTPEEIRAAASRRPSAVYTSDVIDLTDDVFSWTSLSWDEWGVATGDGETLYDDTSLVAQWNFNETSGTTADNAEGTAALDGTLSGFDSTTSQDADPDSSWTANNKRWGAGALQFDGVDSYVDAGSDSSLKFANADNFTLSAWINTSLDSSDDVIMGNSWSTKGYHLRITSANKLRFIVLSSGTDYLFSDSVSTLSPGWHHVVGIWNGTDPTTYVDGKLSSVAGTGGTLADFTAVTNFSIGNATGDSKYFKGTIDSTRIYSRALPAHEILSNYNSTNIEFQTRVGADTSPDDGDWDAWSSVSGETAIESFDTIESATRIYNTLIADSSTNQTWHKANNAIESPSDTTGTDGRLPLGSTGGDTTNIHSPSVIKDGSTYKMWYSGYDGTNYRIYHATSPDGLTWTKYDNSIESPSDTTGTNGRLPLGSTGGDTGRSTYSSIIKDGSTYKMWYTGHDGTTNRLFYATSPDGLTWTKYDNS
ncbi:hypothetical protein HN588_14845, partial [Candidatus Bathyarchaeota archaeon]|nr:hypothetical protein [Candidatus Bathyarchaeota archaeon]